MANNGTGEPDDCAYYEPPLTNVRFWLVTIFGTCVTVVSIVENLFFFHFFATRRHHRRSFNLYLLFLALSDAFVSAAYILLMSMNVLSDYTKWPSLVSIWFQYMVPVLTISHCAITTSCFLILAATFERYCLVTNSKHVRWIQRNRKYIILVVFLVGIVSKGTIPFEFKIYQLEECAGKMTEFRLEFQDFVHNTPYHTVWRFWYRNIFTILFPFFAMFVLNIRIIRALARNEGQNFGGSTRTVATKKFLWTIKKLQRRKLARSATRTTALVVITYLVSNLLEVIMTTLEQLNQKSLLTDHIRLYTIGLDLTSLFTNLACAFRPMIYLICQATLRQEVLRAVKSICSSGQASESESYDLTMVTTALYSEDEASPDKVPFTEISTKDNILKELLKLSSTTDDCLVEKNLDDYDEEEEEGEDEI
ncbi:7 transmembrane receptor (rhodopsin family) domain-containing protein [Ditylenchus destructor]|uniref:7 transmembrane receptor (Rhodopsin family) domain-containing protein n=1 Tax=Ditylenchus destructor TaxID=166010 RepID=A0AAD4N295_9BILA|nr:7 transmembrane receptor (rhodopsin family) domain-containing protein [Ditylenchus destructor]